MQRNEYNSKQTHNYLDKHASVFVMVTHNANVIHSGSETYGSQ